MTPGEFVEALRAYAAATGGSVTSFGRTAARNAAVGGVPLSAHLVWRAADVVYDAPPPRDHRQALAARLGLWLLEESDHDHLEPLDWRPRV